MSIHAFHVNTQKKIAHTSTSPRVVLICWKKIFANIFSRLSLRGKKEIWCLFQSRAITLWSHTKSSLEGVLKPVLDSFFRYGCAFTVWLMIKESNDFRLCIFGCIWRKEATNDIHHTMNDILSQWENICVANTSRIIKKSLSWRSLYHWDRWTRSRTHSLRCPSWFFVAKKKLHFDFIACTSFAVEFGDQIDRVINWKILLWRYK